MTPLGRGLFAVLVVAAGCSGGGDDVSSADAATSSGDDAAPGQVTIRAFGLATALDRIAILRADDDGDTCALLRLVSPANGDQFGIDTPDGWAVEMAGISAGSADCFTDTFTAPDVAGATGAGQVTYTIESGMFYPSTLSVDATVSFDTQGAPAFVPASVAFAATDVTVE